MRGVLVVGCEGMVVTMMGQGTPSSCSSVMCVTAALQQPLQRPCKSTQARMAATGIVATSHQECSCPIQCCCCCCLRVITTTCCCVLLVSLVASIANAFIPRDTGAVCLLTTAAFSGSVEAAAAGTAAYGTGGGVGAVLAPPVLRPATRSQHTTVPVAIC